MRLQIETDEQICKILDSEEVTSLNVTTQPIKHYGNVLFFSNVKYDTIRLFHTTRGQH